MERLANYLLNLYPIDYVPLKRRAILHGVFWLFFFVSLLVGSGFPSDTLINRFIGATSFTITSSVFFYVLIYFLPYLYSKYIGWNRILFIIITIIAFYFFMAFETYIRVILVIDNHWIIDKKSEKYKIYNQVYKAGFWVYFNVNIIISDTIKLIYLSLPAFFMKFIRIFTKVFSEKKQLEIDFLRLQINPHFLVNTLSNIYGLVVTEDKRSGGAVLSLSNLLNYVLYESALPTVAVEQEITFLQNFVALEQIRNASKMQVKMEVEGASEAKIAPLILIAFIENAFKHSMADSTGRHYVHIYIKIEETTLCLTVMNSKNLTVSENQKKSLGGIGLVNVQKRLHSLYPRRHSLQVLSEPDKYQIALEIVLT